MKSKLFKTYTDIMLEQSISYEDIQEIEKYTEKLKDKGIQYDLSYGADDSWIKFIIKTGADQNEFLELTINKNESGTFSTEIYTEDGVKFFSYPDLESLLGVIDRYLNSSSQRKKNPSR